MNFYNQIGKVAIGSRLRRLSESITEDAVKIYTLYGIDMQPRWFPVFYVLSGGEEKTITQIAQEIGHSHPSVSQITKEMLKKGYIMESKNKADGRKNVIMLTEAGLEINNKIQNQYRDIDSALDALMQDTRHDLWKAIEEWEWMLDRVSLYKRVEEQKKLREGQKVQIIDYTPQYHDDFRRLNEEWITKYFKIEEADRKALNHPDEYILDKGGHIFIAQYEGEAVGAIAMLKMDDGKSYELAKMAVAPKAQGKSIGWLLGQKVLDKAREMDARRV
jgi:DNA-binding MarR family transcriptional regulator